MIFSRKNAGKWVASKSGRVISVANKLDTVLKKVDNRKDKASIRFDKVPPCNFAGSGNGI